MKKKITLILILVIGALSAYSQEVGGIVTDAKYDTPLPDVSISISGTPYGAVSDKDGAFKIRGLLPGTYTLMASRVGHMLYEKKIEVTGDGIQGLEIYLQPTSITLNNEVVISARRVASSEFTAPEAIGVLSRQLIDQQIPRTVPEALMGSTGVFTQKTCHGGGSPILRGLMGNQVLLMVDGIRLNSATFRSGPNQYLNTIDAYIVDRLEVVRGSGSVLFGTDALGGVVQVMSRTPSYSKSGFKAGGNLYGRFITDGMEKTGRAEITLANENVAFLGGYTYHDYGDIIAGDTLGKLSPTGYSEFAADGKIAVKLPKNNELILAYQYDKLENVPRYDKIIQGYSSYHFDPQIRQLGYFKYKTHFKNKWFSQVNFTGSFNQSDESRRIQKAGKHTIRYEQDIDNAYGGVIEVYSNPGKNWKAISGIEYYYDKVKSTADEVVDTIGTPTPKRGLYPDGATEGSFALFTSHTVDVNKFSFIAGARLNAFSVQAKDETFGDVDVSPVAFVGNVSVIYDIHSHYNLIASVYSAFRAPNINDLSSFGTFNAGIEVPNKDLDPEKSLCFEIGTRARYERISGSIYLFRNNLTDLIQNMPTTWNGSDTSENGEKYYRKENFATAYIQGVEAELQYRLISWLMAYGNLTYTYGENTDLDEPMSKIPPLYGKLGLYYESNFGFWSRLEWLTANKQDRLSTGDKADSRIPKGGTPGWNVVNLFAGYNWKWLQVSAGLNNMLDEPYRIHGSGVDGYGRSLWLALKVGF